MYPFRNILYLNHGQNLEDAGLAQALALSRSSGADLCVLVMYTALPPELGQHQAAHEQFLRTQVQNAIVELGRRAGASVDPAAIRVEVEGGRTSELRAIRHVLDGGYDLLIKQAVPGERGWGFRSLDMHLLRKCPRPLWLVREPSENAAEPRFVVAIDPLDEDAAGRELAVELLRTAEGLAATHGAELHVLSCWDYEFEVFLRDSSFVRTPAKEIDRMVWEKQRLHRQALDTLLSRAGIDFPYRLHHRRGSPDKVIPAFTREQGIDLLIMGTLARTGVPGFFIGNTAENVLQQLQCSLLALKPPGFVSPVEIS